MSEQRIEQRSELPAEHVEAVLRLVDDVTTVEGVPPLSEAVMLHIRYGTDIEVRHLLMWLGDELVGYAHLDVGGVIAELAAVDPVNIRALVDELIGGTGPSLQVWAHGEKTTTARVLRDLGPERGPSAVATAAIAAKAAIGRAGVATRSDRTHVRGRAGRSRPGSRSITWRSPTTRTSPAGQSATSRPARASRGSIRRASSSPSATTRSSGSTGRRCTPGKGRTRSARSTSSVSPRRCRAKHLGSALTLVGLIHLQGLGLATVMLYVDESNTAAVRVYERLGFTRWDADICFQPFRSYVT